MADQHANFVLVKEVEKRPILYNYHLPGYSKKYETEQAWDEVGKVLNLTGTECKERWKNIRAVFVRHMKTPKSGSGTKEKKAYYLSDALQFTVPYIKTLRKSSGNLSQSPLEEEGVTVINGSIIDDIDNHKDNDDTDAGLLSDTPISPFPTVLPTPKPSSSSSNSTDAFPQHQNSSEPSEKRAKNHDEDSDFSEYLAWKRANLSVTCDQVARDSREESIKMFLLSMLPDVLKMDDAQVRQFKKKTLDTVDDILSAK